MKIFGQYIAVSCLLWLSGCVQPQQVDLIEREQRRLWRPIGASPTTSRSQMMMASSYNLPTDSALTDGRARTSTTPTQIRPSRSASGNSSSSWLQFFQGRSASAPMLKAPNFKKFRREYEVSIHFMPVRIISIKGFVNQTWIKPD